MVAVGLGWVSRIAEVSPAVWVRARLRGVAWGSVAAVWGVFVVSVVVLFVTVFWWRLWAAGGLGLVVGARCFSVVPGLVSAVAGGCGRVVEPGR